MYIYELHHISFFTKSLKEPSRAFQITNWIKFCKTPTRSAAHSKLIYNQHNSKLPHHFYFNRFPHLWNKLPLLDLTLSVHAVIEESAQKSIFISKFDVNIPVLTAETFNFCSNSETIIIVIISVIIKEAIVFLVDPYY